MKYLMDVEVFVNFFLVTFENFVTGEKYMFEISDRKNQIHEFVSFVKTIKKTDFCVTFNGIHYDGVIIFYIVMNYNTLSLLSGDEIAFRIKDVSDTIITSQSEEFPRRLFPYKYHRSWCDVDLFMLLWSKELRRAKAVSLKKLGIQLGYPVVQDLPYHYNKRLSFDEMDNVIIYNSIHDIGITRLLLNAALREVKLRSDIKTHYGIPCMSWDAPKIASKLLGKFYSQFTGDTDYENKRTFRDKIELNKIILPAISLKAEYKNVSFLELLKTRTVKSTKEISYSLYFQNPDGSYLKSDVKSGGLHGISFRGKIEEDRDNIIVDYDIQSFYPSMIIAHNFIPGHLDKRFLDIYKTIKDERLEAKEKGDKIKADTYKLMLNSSFGMMGNNYSWLKDEQAILSVTLNGQLFLLMATEKLIEYGANVIYQNTDGITVRIKRNQEEGCTKILKDLGDSFGFIWEVAYYKSLILRDVNNYIAIKRDNSTKTKGIFVTKPELGNSSDMLIIPIALEAYYSKNTPPEVFIPKYLEDNPNDGIYAFCSSQKVAKSYVVVWGGELQQQINRYYVCKEGKYLYKQRNGGSNAIMKGIPIKIYNNHNGTNPDDIDVQWYINECRKVIEEISPTVKTTLF